MLLMGMPASPPAIIITLTKEEMAKRAIGTITVSRSEARCALKIAYKESRYDPKALNKKSGARGMWQLMWGKPTWNIWKQTDEADKYVKHRYKTWCSAYRHHQERNWY
jgi:hypothetical protein